jgi:hypothetical protein
MNLCTDHWKVKRYCGPTLLPPAAYPAEISWLAHAPAQISWESYIKIAGPTYCLLKRYCVFCWPTLLPPAADPDEISRTFYTPAQIRWELHRNCWSTYCLQGSLNFCTDLKWLQRCGGAPCALLTSSQLSWGSTPFVTPADISWILQRYCGAPCPAYQQLTEIALQLSLLRI